MLTKKIIFAAAWYQQKTKNILVYSMISPSKKQPVKTPCMYYIAAATNHYTAPKELTLISKACTPMSLPYPLSLKHQHFCFSTPDSSLLYVPLGML